MLTQVSADCSMLGVESTGSSTQYGWLSSAAAEAQESNIPPRCVYLGVSSQKGGSWRTQTVTPFRFRSTENRPKVESTRLGQSTSGGASCGTSSSNVTSRYHPRKMTEERTAP